MPTNYNYPSFSNGSSDGNQYQLRFDFNTEEHNAWRLIPPESPAEEGDETMSAEAPEDVSSIDDLRLSPEIEWPSAEQDEPTWTDRGHDSNPVKSMLSAPIELPIGPMGITSDSTVGTYGAEFQPLNSNRLYGYEAHEFFEQAIRHVEEYVEGHAYEPVGLMDSSGSTAGLHIHMSPLSEEMARELWEMSHEPWMKAFTGSSIVNDGSVKATIFRNNFCGFDEFGGFHQAMAHPGGDHWEWRLPEPMRPDHFELLIAMLDTWIQEGRDAARTFALARLREGDERVTAIRRANAVGLTDALQSSVQVTLDRTPHPETVSFYDTVSERPDAPYIYRVTTGPAEYYYFRSFEGDTRAEVEAYDITVEDGLVLDATTLDVVDDDEVVGSIEDALEGTGSNPFRRPGSGPQTSEVTDFLLEEGLLEA